MNKLIVNKLLIFDGMEITFQEWEENKQRFIANMTTVYGQNRAKNYEIIGNLIFKNKFMTLKEIGKQAEISPERTRQIILKIQRMIYSSRMRKMREANNANNNI